MAKAQTPKASSAGTGKAAKKPVVDEDACIGCVACTITCEKVFRMNDKGKAEAYNPEGDSEEKIQEAMDSCPTQAISWK